MILTNRHPGGLAVLSLVAMSEFSRSYSEWIIEYISVLVKFLGKSKQLIKQNNILNIQYTYL